MNQTIRKLIAVLILIQIASAQMSYDVRAGSATETLLSEDSDSYKWLYKRDLSGSFEFQSVRYAPGQTGNKVTSTFTQTDDMTFKAVSKDFTCAAFYDGTTAGSQLLNVIDLTATAALKQELVASTEVLTVTTSNANTNTYEVANSCAAVKVQDSVYHFGGSPAKFRLDAAPAAGWTKVTFSGDFVWGAGNAGIYKYNSVNAADLKYELALASVFNDNKKIWTTSEGIVVLSWVASGTTNINNYTLRAFNIPASGPITVINTLTGQYYTSVTANAPFVSISPNLKSVVIYEKTPADATKFFAKGASISYTAKTLTEFTIPTWITATQSLVSVSDKYLFARNTVDNTATPPAKEVGYYFIAGGALTVYKTPATVVAGDIITDWTRSKITQTRNGQLNIVIETVTSAKLITLTQLPVYVPNTIQIFSWDKKNGVTGRAVSGAGTVFHEHESKPQWFLASKLVGTNYYFESVRADPLSAFAAAKTTYTTDQTHVLKAVSQNYKCALIYESTGPSLKVVNFDVANTATLYATVTASLYTGIDLTAAATTFDVADNCRAFRINDKIFHYYSDSSYYLDTYPVGTTSLSNPVFNADFSIAVTDNGIYKYTAKTAAADGIYTVDRAETFASVKRVYKDGNNYVIATQAVANNTHFNWRVQLNTIVNSSSIKVDEFTGTVQTQVANIVISPKLSKIIVQGYSSTNAAQVVYVAKTVDWLNRGVKDITLPSAITSAKVPFALSDEFVYINKYETDKKHGAWAFMGTTLFEILALLPYQYPIIDFTRSWILPDLSGERKLVLAHQYSTVGEFIRLFKDQRKSLSQILNPNPISTAEMTLSYSGGSSFKYPRYPYFGKWMYTTSTGTTLNYVEYKTSQANKKKIVTKTGLTGNNLIVANSQNFDCALTFVSGSDLMTLKINPDYTVSTLSAWTIATTADMTAAQVASSIGSGAVGVGAACWAVRIGGFVYFRNTAGDAFTKSAKIATLTNPVFDQSLHFAYADGKVYQYTGTDYVQIVTVTGLKSTVKIVASQDKKKFLLFSYQLTAVGATSWATTIRAYYYGTSWNSVTLPSNIGDFTTYSGNPYPIVEPTLETIGVWYYIQSGSGTRPQIYLAKADYAAGTLSLYENPAEWLGNGVSPYFSPYGNFLYVYRVTDTLSGNVYTELFYKLDKANTKIVLISSRPVSGDQASTIRNGKFIEQSGNIYALYEYHSGTDVTLIKRLLGSQSTQATLRGIEAKDAGLLVQNGQVFICPAGCSYCLNTNTCETCLPGFTLDSNKNCLRCSQLCSSCAATNLATCTGCINGYALVGGACQQCSSDCLTCSTSPTACTACKAGYYVSSSRCLPCIDNCVSCNPSAATDALCNTCRKGYVYNSVTKTCVKCVAGCVNCNPLKVFECLKCGQGFDSTFNNGTLTCTKCPDNCITCIGQQCSVCRNGFRLLNNSCIAQCKLPCQQCSTTDATKCTSCVGGYTLNGQACSPDLSCNSNKTCTSCPIGYNLIASVCYQCNGGANCRTCDNLNIEVCASCNKGYYLTSTYTCAACNITGCVACSTELFCQQCKSGYVLSGSADSGKCVKCDDSCATCFDSPVNCETCAQGYTKKGWNCINNNNIKVELKVNADIATFSTTNYESIETQIAEKISKDRKHITVEQIKTGSVIVTMTINNNNLGQQASLLSTLQTALVNGASIGGFSIETSSLTAVNLDASGQPMAIYTNNNNDSQAKRYRDIAIIVGVVIPVGLIIIFIIFFILYKKGIICANEATKVRDTTIVELNTNQKESSLHQMRKN